MAVAPEIKEIGMLQLKALSDVFEESGAWLDDYDESKRVDKLKEVLSKKLLEDITPKILSIFKHYDTAEPHGFWGPAEAATFFGHYAEHFPHMETALVTKEIACKISLKKEIARLGGVKSWGMVQIEVGSYRKESVENVDAWYAAEVKKQTDENTKQLEEQKKTIKAGKYPDSLGMGLQRYQEKKKERDEEAFKLLDASSDQTIELSVLMAAVQPGNRENYLLIGALGFDDGKEPLVKEPLVVTCVGGCCEIIGLLLK